MTEATIEYGKKKLILTPPHGYLVTKVSGNATSNPVIKASSNAQTDGSYIESDRVSTRRLQISVVPLNRAEAENKRKELISTIIPHEDAEITITRSGVSRKITGRMSGAVSVANSGVYWTRVYTFEFLCVDPFWRDVTDKQVVFRQVAPLLSFPLNLMTGAGTVAGMQVTGDARYLLNLGDTEVGVVATVVARAGQVVNPSISDGTNTVKVLVTMNVGDVLVISTVPGKKYIKLNGANYMTFDRASVFFSVPRGVSEISVDAESGTSDNLRAKVVYSPQYSGV